MMMGFGTRPAPPLLPKPLLCRPVLPGEWGSLSNPVLHVCLFTKDRCVDFLRYTALIAADMLSLDKSVEIYPASRVEIRCNVKQFAAELDGDAVVTSPLSISLLPKALQFIS